MKYLAIHHTAVARTNRPQLWAVNRYHRDKWGMISSLGWYVGYNFFVDYDGTITKTRRPMGEETIAQKGHNCDVPERCDTVSVCFALDGNTQKFNEAQVAAYRKLQDRFSALEVTLHKNLQANRTCPGKNISLKYLRDLLKVDPDNNSEKAQKIAELQKQLDYIRQRLRAIFASLQGR